MSSQRTSENTATPWYSSNIFVTDIFILFEDWTTMTSLIHGHVVGHLVAFALKVFSDWYFYSF